jgi:hypothetical protein
MGISKSRFFCDDCFYWVRSETDEEIGQCRRHPPIITPTPTGFPTEFMLTAPATRWKDFCGEFKRDPELDEELDE